MVRRGGGRKRRKVSLIIFFPFSDSSPNKHGRVGEGQAKDSEDDDGHRDCLYHLLVAVQLDVSLVRREKEE